MQLKPDVIERFQCQFKQQQKEEYDAGHVRGAAWAQEKATPMMLAGLVGLRQKPITGSRSLARYIANAVGSEHRPILYTDVFGEYLDTNHWYNSPYLRGFVDGALEVWDAVREHLKAEDQADLLPRITDTVAHTQTAWKGWYRGGRNQPWVIIVEGATEIEVIEKLMSANLTGEKIALCAGKHPDQVTGRNPTEANCPGD